MNIVVVIVVHRNNKTNRHSLRELPPTPNNGNDNDNTIVQEGPTLTPQKVLQSHLPSL